MENDYTLNPIFEILLAAIEPGSKEKEVQALSENVLWTVYPAVEHFSTLTKYEHGATEPDNITMKIVLYNTGWATTDILYGELKRRSEDISMKAFQRVAKGQLDDHMMGSTIPNGETLFGFVGIGKHVVFFKKVIDTRWVTEILNMHNEPLHWKTDAGRIQSYFQYFKENIPGSRPAPSARISSSSSSYPANSGNPSTASSSNAPAYQANYGGYGNPSTSSSSNAPTYQANYGSYEDPSTASSIPAQASTVASSSSKLSAPSRKKGYWVKDGQYYDENNRPIGRDKIINKWVFNEMGWSEANREKYWRRWDGKNETTYK